jgi:hypothetical protein
VAGVAPRGSARVGPSRLAVWCAGRPPAAATAALAAVGVPLWVADDPAAAARAHAGRDGLVVGISAAGALPADAIGAALTAAAGGGCAVLAGFDFGQDRGAGRCLPPDAADVHIRLGRPLRPLSLAESLRALAAAVQRHDRRTGRFGGLAVGR